jgi:hypothetical protein
MGEIDLRDRLCSRYCPYYKPLIKEELACKGFLVVERCISQGKEIPFIISDKILAAGTENTLREHLCLSCPFYESDCDFAQQKDGAPPCGGFSLLGILIEASVLTIDNIRDIR